MIDNIYNIYLYNSEQKDKFSSSLIVKLMFIIYGCYEFSSFLSLRFGISYHLLSYYSFGYTYIYFCWLFQYEQKSETVI